MSSTTTTTRPAIAARKPLGHLGTSHLDSAAQFHAVPPRIEEKSPTSILVTSALMGFLFGFALEKGNVYQPDVIRGQFLFADNTMLKMFLAASAASAVSIQVLNLLYARRKANLDAATEYTTTFTRGVAAVLTGGIILGLGMQLSGSCPGTVWVQAGAGAPGFVAVYAGGLTGAIAFSYLYSSIEKSGLLTSGTEFLRKYPSLPNKGYTGFLLAAAFAGIVIAADFLSPQPFVAQSTGNILTRVSWHPAMAGVIVGLLEIPAAIVLGELIGSAQSYVTVSGNVMRQTRSKIPAYLEKYVSGLANHKQVLYGAAAVVGALVSWGLSHDFAYNFGALVSLDSASSLISLSSAESFLGGFLLVFGARLSAGCTSGHGISGMGSLATGSFIAVMGMFGGAIGLAVLRTVL